MSTLTIINMIIAMAPGFGIDPYIAVAVAQTESSMNPKARGLAGEIGLFQIMPNEFKARGFTAKQMEMPAVNISVGLDMLRQAKEKCLYKGELTSLVCYNVGVGSAKNIRHPEVFPYVLRVKTKVLKMLHSNKGYYETQFKKL